MGSNLEMFEQGHQSSAIPPSVLQQQQQQNSALSKTLLWLERRISFVPKLPNKTGGDPAGGLVREYGLVAPITFLAILVWGGKLAADWLAYLALVDVNFAYRLRRWQLAQTAVTSPSPLSATNQWDLSIFYANVTTILLAFCVAESCVIFVEVVQLFVALRWQKTSFLKRRDGLAKQEDSALVSYVAYAILLCHTAFGDLPVALIWYLVQRGICCTFIVYFRNVQTVWSLALCIVSGSLKLALIIFGYPGQRRMRDRRLTVLKITSAHFVFASIIVSSIGLVLRSSTSPVTNDVTSSFVKTRIDYGLTHSFVSLQQISGQHADNGTMGSIFDSSNSNDAATLTNSNSNVTLRNLTNQSRSHTLHITQLLNIFVNTQDTYLSSDVNCIGVPKEYFPHLTNATKDSIAASDVIACTCRFYFFFNPSDYTFYYDSTYRLVTNHSCVLGKFYPSVYSQSVGTNVFTTSAMNQSEASSTASSVSSPTTQQPDIDNPESTLFDWTSAALTSTNQQSESLSWWDLTGPPTTSQQTNQQSKLTMGVSASTYRQSTATVGVSSSTNEQSDSALWVPLLHITPSFPCSISIAQLDLLGLHNTNNSHSLLTCSI